MKTACLSKEHKNRFNNSLSEISKLSNNEKQYNLLQNFGNHKIVDVKNILYLNEELKKTFRYNIDEKLWAIDEDGVDENNREWIDAWNYSSIMFIINDIEYFNELNDKVTEKNTNTISDNTTIEQLIDIISKTTLII